MSELASHLSHDSIFYGFVRTTEAIDSTLAVKFIFLSFIGEHARSISPRSPLGSPRHLPLLHRRACPHNNPNPNPSPNPNPNPNPSPSRRARARHEEAP